MSFRTRARFSLFLVAAVTAVLLAGCSEDRSGSNENAAAAQAPREEAPAASGIPEDEPVAQVAAAVGPSVVQVNVQVSQQTPTGTQRGAGLGSGVIYREDGHIVTNAHVVKGASDIEVAFADGTTEPAELVGSDPTSEIAVLKVDRGNLPAATFKTDEAPIVGQLAVAIGSPAGFEATVTSGIVSAVGREFPEELVARDDQAQRALVDLIQTDAAISPGNSGGALVDRDGNIIGVNVAYLPPGETGAVNLGFAIPSDTAVSVADQLMETGEVTTPYLGVGTVPLPPEVAERFDLPVDSGALVQTVEPGSGADEAGVRRNDVITALGDTKVGSYGDLFSALRDYQPGNTVRLTIVRNGDERTLDVALGERPENP
ncbi:MAG: trypsin-like peptidase domain-containing protein [Rubrobacter sp.]